MCLIAFSWKQHPQYPLVLVANRDEFFTRPTAPLHKWESGVYAGRDLKSQGTWMGVHPSGRFAALTNYRDLNHLKPNPVSRGKLVRDFLESDQSPEDYMEKVAAIQGEFDGFNLLVSDMEDMWYLSNHGEGVMEVHPGLHGISNALMDDPWKKVVESKARLSKALQKKVLSVEDLEKVTMSTVEEQDGNLPQTGLPLGMEKAVSAAFIKPINRYGTVNTSVILWGQSGKVSFSEKRVLEEGGFEKSLLEFSSKAT
ncbi:NRDE family protein [Echinicola sediminis]